MQPTYSKNRDQYKIQVNKFEEFTENDQIFRKRNTDRHASEILWVEFQTTAIKVNIAIQPVTQFFYFLSAQKSFAYIIPQSMTYATIFCLKNNVHNLN